LLRFPVERWLDINEGDKRISLDLEPNKKPESKVSAGKQIHRFFIYCVITNGCI
jgi:hypothetical protein